MNDVVPKGWSISQLGHEIDIISGYPFKSSEFTNNRLDVGLIRIRDLLEQELETFYNGEYSAEFVVKKGDILIGMDGDFHIVKWKSQDALLNQRICKLVPKKDAGFDVNFVHYFLIPELVKIHNQTTATTVKHLSVKDIRNVETAFPPLAEQKKIASILTSVDEVIENTQKQIDKLRALKKATMNELLTKGIGHTEFKESELGRIPKSWEVKKLESLINLLTDFEANGSFADVKANVKVYDHFEFAWYVRATDLENNTPLSKVKYVDELTYNFLRKTQLSDEEILIAKRGEIGKVYFYRNRGLPATAAPNTYLLRLNELCDPFYLFCYLTSTDGVKRLKQINASTTIGALYKNDVKSFKILVPSKEEQQQISKIILSFDDKLKNCEAKIAQTQALKKSLMQDLLTGKVRVQVN